MSSIDHYKLADDISVSIEEVSMPSGETALVVKAGIEFGASMLVSEEWQGSNELLAASARNRLAWAIAHEIEERYT